MRGGGGGARVTAGLDHVAKVQTLLGLAQFSAVPEAGQRVRPLTDPSSIHKIKDGSLCGARESVVTNPDK